jgi:phospholipid-binding lipoprotein MlaA
MPSARSRPVARCLDFGDHSKRDGRREFAYVAAMSGQSDLRLHRRATRLQKGTARRWVIAACAALALSLSSSVASAAAANFDAKAEPSLVGRLGEIAGSVYDKAQSHLIAPSQQAADEFLAYLRIGEIYRHLSEMAQGLVALADGQIVRPIWRGSGELVARLEHAAEGAMAPSPSPSPAPAAATPHLATAANRLPPALAIPGLPEGDILRNLNGNDPLEPFNRLMFHLNGGLQAKLLGPASQFYLDHTPAKVQLGVGNFFHNLREPATFVSSALEGQLNDAGTAAARFGINTTLGIAGFRDPATEMGFTVRPRNLEETLCSYALPSGPYLVLPILGPATLRDAVGRIATVVMYFEVMGAPAYIPYRITDFTVQYAMAKEKIDLIKSMSIDPYATQKALYLAIRDLGCGEQATIHREFFAR